MELKEIIKERFSVRSFLDQPVSVNTIAEMIEMVRLAPSAVNFQPWHFIILTGKSRLEEIWPVYHRSWFQTAPVIVVACTDHRHSWKRAMDGKDFGDADVAIAVDHLTLAATSLGLGTCWVCNFNVPLCRKVMQLPEYLEPLALIPLGYPAVTAPEKKRKSLEEIVSWEEYGNHGVVR